METVYTTFLERVASGRGMDTSAVHRVAQGRVWSGRQALGHDLVDRLGGLEEAIALAREAAGIQPDQTVTVEVFPKVERSLLQRMVADLFGEEGEDEATALLQGMVPAPLRPWLAAAGFPNGVPLALMPFTLEIR
jgi:protease-4